MLPAVRHYCGSKTKWNERYRRKNDMAGNCFHRNATNHQTEVANESKSVFWTILLSDDGQFLTCEPSDRAGVRTLYHIM